MLVYVSKICEPSVAFILVRHCLPPHAQHSDRLGHSSDLDARKEAIVMHPNGNAFSLRIRLIDCTNYDRDFAVFEKCRCKFPT